MNNLVSKNPRQEAWLYSFLDENHLNYSTSPDLVASPAQLKFMVFLEPDQNYFPCSQKLFDEIMARVKSPFLGELYSEVWSRISNLVETKIEDEVQREFLIDLLNIKYQHETNNYNVIPSRLEKRLFKLFMVTTQIEDPLLHEKAECNRRAHRICGSQDFIRAVNRFTDPCISTDLANHDSLEDTRRTLDSAKLRRLFQASVQKSLWEEDENTPTMDEWNEIFDIPLADDGWGALEDFILTPDKELTGHYIPRKILYISNRAGEIVFDLAVIKFLVRLGHTVILSVKNAAFYDCVYLGDIVNNHILRELIDDAEIILNPALSQNELAAHLRNDIPFKIITDGTMEKLNLMRSSVSFSRVFKEMDGVISKGRDQRGRIFETDFEFTKDIYSLAPGDGGSLSTMFRALCPRAVRFTTADLEAKADEIIAKMKATKDKAGTVMFYSGIVGSIPGETDTAIEVMTKFVEYLESQQAETFIINPSKYFVHGMDADDLMYMWEIVQRSGFINIWRFQTYQDIEQSFSIMDRKVPPQWVGKDSTFSTGCTKEMAIALDVQKKNPEMQIIGPDPEKFMRRSEYGIGLFHDTRLSEIISP